MFSREAKEFVVGHKSHVLLPVLLFILALGVFGTNKYFGIDDESTRRAAGDSVIYDYLANNFPDYPDGKVTFVPHGAERFILPFIVGCIRSVSNLGTESIFRTFSVCFLVLLWFVVWRIMGIFKLSMPIKSIFMGMLICSPYTTRYYLSYPWMSSDLLFTLGTASLLYALLKVKSWLMLFTFLVMVSARQTAFALLPATAIWLSFDKAWNNKKSSTYRIFITIVATAICVAILSFQKYYSSGFVSDYNYTNHLTGILSWLKTGNPIELANFVAHGLYTFLLPAVVLLFMHQFKNKLSATEYLLIILILAVSLQPFIAGPTVTGGSVIRLANFGYVPFLILCGSYVQRYRTMMNKEVYLPFIFLLVFTTSFHHRYSIVGAFYLSKSNFGYLAFMASILVGFSIRRMVTLESKQ